MGSESKRDPEGSPGKHQITDHLLAAVGATSADRLNGGFGRISRLGPRAETISDPEALLHLADVLSRFRPDRLFGQQAVGHLTALQFAYHDFVHLAALHRFPSGQAAADVGSLVNLASGCLRLGSLYGRRQVSGDFSRRLSRLMRDGWARAKFRLPPRDILRLHDLIGGPGAPLSFEEIEQLPPHLRILYSDRDGPKLNRAIIPDMRNDQSLLISQFQRALMAEHNARVDRINAASVEGLDQMEVFRRARQELVEAFQGFLCNDVLRDLCVPQSLALFDLDDPDAAASFDRSGPVVLEAVLVFETLLLLSQFARVHPQPGSRHRVSSGAFVSVLPDLALRGLPDALFSTPRWPQSLAAANRVVWSAFLRGANDGVITLRETGFGGDDPDQRRRQSLALLEMANLFHVASGQAIARWCAKAFEMEIPVVHHKEVLQALGAERLAMETDAETPLPLYVALEGELIGRNGRLGPMASILIAEALRRAISLKLPDASIDFPIGSPDSAT